MNIRYTRHARQRMAERKVSEDQVSETVESPDNVAVGDEGEMIALRDFGTHILRVVYSELEAETLLVYTVIRLRGTGSNQR
jgi:hypothetical protein